jgi:hypothetical protein
MIQEQLELHSKFQGTLGYIVRFCIRKENIFAHILQCVLGGGVGGLPVEVELRGLPPFWLCKTRENCLGCLSLSVMRSPAFTAISSQR